MRIFRIIGRSFINACKSIARNFSLSIASITCTIITLILVSIGFLISYNVNNITKEIEQEINESMQEIIERWQPFIDNIPVDELFAEKQKQIRNFSDYETTLTDLVEKRFNEM